MVIPLRRYVRAACGKAPKGRVKRTARPYVMQYNNIVGVCNFIMNDIVFNCISYVTRVAAVNNRNPSRRDCKILFP